MTPTTHEEVTDPRISPWCRLHDFRLGKMDELVTDHERRVRALEAASNRAAGYAAAAAVTGSALVTAAMRLLGG